MDLEFIIKIKDEHNPPDFNLGKGVIATQAVKFPTKTIEDLQDPIVLVGIIEMQNELLNKFFEVQYKVL